MGADGADGVAGAAGVDGADGADGADGEIVNVDLLISALNINNTNLMEILLM